MLAINPAIFWKLLYKTITKVLKTGQSKGNLRYKLLEILRGHTQEVIIIILFFLDFKNSSSFDLNSSVLLINNLNFSFVTCQRKSTGTAFALLPLQHLLLHKMQENLCLCKQVPHRQEAKVATLAQGDLNIPLKKQALETVVKKSFRTINQNFSSYLAGLFEGDGCIWIPINERDKTNKIIYPMITLTFNSKDFPLISIIQEKLDIGQIYKVKGKNAYTYRISNVVSLYRLVNIINGYIRTPKIYKLNKLIEYLNNKGYDINKYPLDLTPLNSNAWLSGFIDADGHFSVRVSTDKKNILKRIACSLEISQSQKLIDLEGNNNFYVLSLIGNYLLCQVKVTKSNSKNPQHRIRTTSLAGNIVLKNYLLKYPLFTSKFLDSKDWMEVLYYFENKEHKNKYNEIIQIKSSMNDRRTVFHWNHLKNFYKLHN